MSAGADVADNSGAYGIVAYDNSKGAASRPDKIRIEDNEIIDPRSCGIYTAGGGDG